MSIVLSNGVRAALSSLQSTSALAQVAQNRLATGKKVNSALDNPANFFVSAGLTNRANDLSRLLDSMGQAVKTLEAADKGIKALTKLVETAQGTARQALQAASTAPKVTSALSEVTGTTTLTSAAGGSFVAGNTITVSFNGTAGTAFNVGAGSTVQDLADAINQDNALQGGATAEDGARIRAFVDNGRLVIESQTGDDIEIAVADGTGAAGSSVTASANLFGTPTSSTATSATYTVAENFNATRTSLAKQFNELRSQINGLVEDTGYNGVNLLNADSLRVQFNEGNTTSLTIAGVKFDADALGITSDLTTTNLQTDSSIQDALSVLDTAMNTLRAQASTFGANLSVVQNREDFTKGLISTLRSGSDALVLADANEEGANLLALNTRTQLSQTALTLASQADQAVLRLF